jgi:hypothetical protein
MMAIFRESSKPNYKWDAEFEESLMIDGKLFFRASEVAELFEMMDTQDSLRTALGLRKQIWEMEGQ